MKRCFLFVFFLALASCGSALRQPFHSYNQAYADTQNEQMLLNLARLHNGHPPYFMAIGAINDKFTFTGSTTGGGSRTGTAGSNLTNSQTYSRTATQGATLGTTQGTTQGVTNTLTKTTQNQLASAKGRTGTTVTTTNQNTAANAAANSAGSTTGSSVGSSVGSTVAATMASAAGVADTVVRGLTGSASASAQDSPEFQLIPLNSDLVAKQFLQPISTDVFFTLYQQGYPIDQLLRLLVESIEASTPDTSENLVLENSPLNGSRLTKLPNGQKISSFARFLRTCAILREMQLSGLLLMETMHATKLMVSIDNNWKMQGKDLLDADDKHLHYQKRADGGLDVMEEKSTPTFYLRREMVPSAKRKLYESTALQAVDHHAIDNVVDLLALGLEVKGKGEAGQGAYSRLTLRSYFRAMEAAATEQDGFDALLGTPDFNTNVPKSELRPVLRTLWTGKQPQLVAPLQVVHYAGRTYQITDPVLNPLDPAVRWNRDAFRILTELGSEVAVDISKFQRQVLELR